MEEVFKYKDLIYYLGTIIDKKDLLNYFLISKIFYLNTHENCNFWIKRLEKDFNFKYTSISDLLVVRYHYALLHDVNIDGIDVVFPLIPVWDPNFTDLSKYFQANREKFIFRCEYIFLRGPQRGNRCNLNGRKYGQHIFCSNCTKRRIVLNIIKNSQ